jgi:hypothetical protein
MKTAVQKSVSRLGRVFGSVLQRQCACGQQAVSGGKCEKCAGEQQQKLLRRASGPAPSTAVPPAVHEVLRSSGQPLDSGTRAFMEQRYAHDFSSVRVHADAQAGESAQAVNASAYTVGRHVVFAPGQYAPDQGQGQHLLAHELAHVVQQQHAGTSAPERISQPDDVEEKAAGAAAAGVMAGARPTAMGAGTLPSPAVQRQTPGQGSLSTGPVNQQSQGVTVLESFLNGMWEAQSKKEKPFRITPLVRQGLGYIFQFVPSLPMTDYASAAEVIARLRSQVPSTVPENTIRALDTLPKLEKPLEGKSDKDKEPEPATPDFGAGKLPQGVGGPPKLPEPPKGYSDAAAAALKQFLTTPLGQELEKWGKAYVLSAEGVPFDLFVVGTTATVIAANSLKLPGIPEIPVGKGIKIKIDYSGTFADAPTLVREMLRGETERAVPGQSEKKMGLTVTFTNEALINFGKSVGSFFAKAASWFAQGIIKIGTVIGKAARSIARELIGILGGAAIGAGIGALVGGPVGALVGAGIGALVGLGGALLSHLFDKKKKS